MTEADILALTYTDTCTVYRPFKEELPSGESVFRKGLEGHREYEDIPCALSSPSGGKLLQNPSTATVETDYMLFVRPEINILPNDMVVVAQLGSTIVTVAGLAQRYLSHTSIPLRLRKETA